MKIIKGNFWRDEKLRKKASKLQNFHPLLNFTFDLNFSKFKEKIFVVSTKNSETTRRDQNDKFIP